MSNNERKNPFMDEEKNQTNATNITSSTSITVPSKSSHNYKYGDEDDGGYDEDGTDPVNGSMRASYREIAFHSNLPKSDQLRDNNKESKHDSASSTSGEDDDYEEDYDNECETIEQTKTAKSKKSSKPKRPVSLVCNNSFPYNLEGTVSKDGNMTHFVAENLEYKIKISSPVNKKDYPGGSSSRNSTPSTSGLITRQFLLPQQLPQIDSNVLNDIEIEAQYLAASVDNLTENLCNLLHSVSSITADNVEIHKNAVNKLTDSMDANIKCMYTIMAKTEEISKSMRPTEQLAHRIREIKRLVDMLENNL